MLASIGCITSSLKIGLKLEYPNTSRKTSQSTITFLLINFVRRLKLSNLNLILSGAFYSIPISPGLRLVSLNMNYCPRANFWLFINATDPLDQLSWLAATLQESETKGEKVHIIGHIHPDDCLDSWQANFYRIIQRYEATVTGLFFGHSHSDEFMIMYDEHNKTRAYAISYISGSVTTYSYLNPNYRVYTIDGAYANSSYQVLDHENIFMNITDANLTNKPKWTKEYSAKV